MSYWQNSWLSILFSEHENNLYLEFRLDREYYNHGCRGDSAKSLSKNQAVEMQIVCVTQLPRMVDIIIKTILYYLPETNVITKMPKSFTIDTVGPIHACSTHRWRRNDTAYLQTDKFERRRDNFAICNFEVRFAMFAYITMSLQRSPTDLEKKTKNTSLLIST